MLEKTKKCQHTNLMRCKKIRSQFYPIIASWDSGVQVWCFQEVQCYCEIPDFNWMHCCSTRPDHDRFWKHVVVRIFVFFGISSGSLSKTVLADRLDTKHCSREYPGLTRLKRTMYKGSWSPWLWSCRQNSATHPHASPFIDTQLQDDECFFVCSIFLPVCLFKE